MKTRNEKIEDFLTGLDTEIDVLNCVDVDNISDFDTLQESIDNSGGFDIDIIYYSTAMEYLTNNDTSLYESMQIAEDMGFSPANLNSETLASLLASQNIRTEFYTLESEVNEFFEELTDYEDLLADLENKKEELDDLETKFFVDKDLEKDIEDIKIVIEELKNELEN